MCMVFYPADSLSILLSLKHLDVPLTTDHLTDTLGPISVFLMYAFCLLGCLLNFFVCFFVFLPSGTYAVFYLLLAPKILEIDTAFKFVWGYL